MRTKLPYVAAAAAISGALMFAGVSLASAQTSGTTPSTTAPSDQGGVAPGNGTPPANNGDNPNCPNMGGSSGSGQASTTGYARHNRQHASSAAPSNAV